jgi:hypothetical protein
MQLKSLRSNDVIEIIEIKIDINALDYITQLALERAIGRDELIGAILALEVG